MPVKYALFEYNLTSEPNGHAAKVQITGTARLEQIAQRMADQGSTTTKADILAVLEDAERAVISYLLEGYRVQFGELAEMYPRIKGIFNGAADAFDPARHSVDVVANPGTRVRNDVRARATTQKVDAVPPAPAPMEFVDLGSGTHNDEATNGSIATVNGSRLQFNAAQADEGVFFVPTGGGAAIVIPVANVQKNKPAQLVFLLPAAAALPPGTYRLEVRARQKDSVQLRSGRLDATLTVV